MVPPQKGLYSFRGYRQVLTGPGEAKVTEYSGAESLQTLVPSNEDMTIFVGVELAASFAMFYPSFIHLSFHKSVQTRMQ